MMRRSLLPSLLCIALCMHYATAQWSTWILSKGINCEDLCENKPCNALNEYKACKCIPREMVQNWLQFYALPINPGVMCLMSPSGAPKCCGYYKKQKGAFSVEVETSVQTPGNPTQNREIEQLKKSLSDLKANISSTLEEQDQKLETQDQELNNLTQVWSGEPWKKFARRMIEGSVNISGGVGFTAYLDHDAYIGTYGVVRYNKVISNDGGGYNRYTGIFTCPENGTYVFTFSVATYSGNSMDAELVINNIDVVNAYSYALSSRYLQSGNTALVRIKKGDIVMVKYTNNGYALMEGALRMCSFTGYLLHN